MSIIYSEIGKRGLNMSIDFIAIDLLEGSKITDIRYIYKVGKSGKGSYCLFQIDIDSEGKRLVIEAENDFRIVQKGKRLLCWNDLFLDKNYELLYDYDDTLKDFDQTLLSVEIKKCFKRLINKKITKIRISSYGDVEITAGKDIKLQFLDSINRHYFSIFRLVKFETQEGIDRKFILYDIKNKKRGIQIDDNSLDELEGEAR